MKSFFSILLIIFSSNVIANNILNRGNGSEPDSLNIHQAQGINSHNILRDLYEGLMTLDKEGQPIYGAAISHSQKNNLWTFKLRKTAQWSNGEKVVADDFIRAWRQAIDPKTAAPYAFLFDNVLNAKKIVQSKMAVENLGVHVIDAHTISIQLNQPDSAFLEKLSLPIFYPKSSSQVEKHQIISNGTYRLKDWRIQEKIVIQKNPFHSDAEKIYFDQVNYWVTENQSSELKRFRANEIDVTESIPDSQIGWIKANLPSELKISPYLGSFFLGVNIEDKYLKNHKLRKALSLAIDRDILAQKVLKTGQQPAYHVIPRELLGVKTHNINIDQSGNLIKAKKLLKESGINPNHLKIEILYNSSENQRKVAIAIAAMWRQFLGIKSRLINQEWKVFVQSRKSSERQVFRSGWIADFADALSFLDLFTTDSPFNFYKYSNNKFDLIVEKVRRAPDNKIKNQLITQAETLLLHDLPVIPLYYYVSRHMVKSNIKGFNNNISDRHLSRYLYKED